MKSLIELTTKYQCHFKRPTCICGLSGTYCKNCICPVCHCNEQSHFIFQCYKWQRVEKDNARYKTIVAMGHCCFQCMFYETCNSKCVLLRG